MSDRDSRAAGERRVLAALAIASELTTDERTVTPGDVLHVLDGGTPGGQGCGCFGELAEEIEERLRAAGLRS